jgi:putative addiction module killer protein
MRLSVGGFGDAKSIGGGISELRIDYGPGFRVYFARRGNCVVFLLGGGDKSTQQADIRKATALWEEIKRNDE